MATEAQLDQEKLEAFVERIVLDAGTAMRGGLMYIGDRLGIFAALAESGPVTATELAQRTGLDERYLREWLGAMATAEYVEHDSEGDTYFLAPEHALPLADEAFPFFTGGLLQMIVPTVTVAPQVAEAFKSGRGVTQDRYLPDMYEAIERLTAPWYKHELVQTWIPALPGVQEKLQAGGSACDVGCGSGRAPITIARAFPAADVHGYDVHAGSIERAQANAKADGVAATSNSLFDAASTCLARVMRFLMAAWLLTKAAAISSTLKPHRMCSISATCASSGSRGWQQENIMRSWSSLMAPGSNCSCITGTSVHSRFEEAAQLGREGAGGAFAAEDVERAILGRGHQPGGGIFRHAAKLPDFQRAAEGVLHHVFCQREVVHAEDSGQRGHHAACFASEEMLLRVHGFVCGCRCDVSALAILLLLREVAEHVGMDVQADVGDVVDVFAGHQPDDFADGALGVVAAQNRECFRIYLFVARQLGDVVKARVFVGPKDLTLLSKVKPPLEELVQFGWTGIIAKPIFEILKWIYRFVPNYGWAIVILTLIINMAIFPFKMKSWRSMQKMQKVAPEIKSIQDRYKKYG